MPVCFGNSSYDMIQRRCDVSRTIGNDWFRLNKFLPINFQLIEIFSCSWITPFGQLPKPQSSTRADQSIELSIVFTRPFKQRASIIKI